MPRDTFSSPGPLSWPIPHHYTHNWTCFPAFHWKHSHPPSANLRQGRIRPMHLYLCPSHLLTLPTKQAYRRAESPSVDCDAVPGPQNKPQLSFGSKKYVFYLWNKNVTNHSHGGDLLGWIWRPWRMTVAEAKCYDNTIALLEWMVQ